MAQISFEGRLTADAEIKYTSDGKPMAKFTVAENFRSKNPQTGEWEDSGATFHNVALFGRLAETAPLTKGTVVAVSGTQKSRAYQSQQGEKRTWTETTTNSVGVVPIQRRQDAPAQASPQGEQWNSAPAPQTPAQSGWGPVAQPGQGFDQNPPF